MQRTAHLNWLGKLAALAVLTTGLAQAATMTINAGDVQWNQDGAGTDVRIRYGAVSNAYYLNTNTGAAWISTYQNGLSSYSNDRRVDEGGGTAYLSRSSDLNATYIWSVNLPQAIDSVSILNSSASWRWETRDTYITWYTSTNNGGSWQQYAQITSYGTGGGFATDGGAVNNLTAALAGQTSFQVMAVLQGNGEWTPPLNVQIFRTGGGPDYGLDMQISLVPEPASLGLLVLGGLFVLRRRRN